MLSLLRIVIGFIAISIAVGCNQRTAEHGHVFGEVTYAPKYALGFVIDCDTEHNTIIRVTRPWQGKAQAEQSLAIFRSENEAHDYRGQHIIGNAERVVCMSSSYIAMLDAVGKAE